MNLSQTYEEIIGYAQSHHIAVFRATAAPLDLSPLLIWESHDGDWRSFVNVAKEAGARCLIVSKEAHVDKPRETGRVAVVWLSDGLAYAYVEQEASWTEPRDEPPRIRWEMSPEDEEDQKFSQALRAQTAEELAEDLAAFIQSSFPDTEPWGVRQRARLFWQTKGSLHGYYPEDADTQMKMEQAETLAQRKVEDARWEREKSTIKQLVDECVEWARQRDLKRLTKSNADYFLREKGIALSQLSRDALYNEVNFRLGR